MISKNYNVRIIRDLAVDIIKEFDTLEEAREYAKNLGVLCVISQVVEEVGGENDK